MTKLLRKYPEREGVEVLYDGRIGGPQWNAVSGSIRGYLKYYLTNEAGKDIATIDTKPWDNLNYTAQGYQRLAQEIEKIAGRDDLTVTIH